MSKIFKSSRVILDDKAFVLSAKAKATIVDEELGDLAVPEVFDASEAVNQLLDHARLEADRILEAADLDYEEKMQMAQNSSDSIVSNAYDQAKGIMEQARAEGYQDGYNRGVEDSQEIAKQIVDEALVIKQEWADERVRVIESAEVEMVHLVIEAIEKVLDYKVETDQTLIESLIRQGISRVTKSHLVSIDRKSVV